MASFASPSVSAAPAPLYTYPVTQRQAFGATDSGMSWKTTALLFGAATGAFFLLRWYLDRGQEKRGMATAKDGIPALTEKQASIPVSEIKLVDFNSGRLLKTYKESFDSADEAEEWLFEKWAKEGRKDAGIKSDYHEGPDNKTLVFEVRYWDTQYIEKKPKASQKKPKSSPAAKKKGHPQVKRRAMSR